MAVLGLRRPRLEARRELGAMRVEDVIDQIEGLGPAGIFELLLDLLEGYGLDVTDERGTIRSEGDLVFRLVPFGDPVPWDPTEDDRWGNKDADEASKPAAKAAEEG